MQKRIFCALKRPLQPAFNHRIAGFTLIELMISLLLLAVAAALSLPSYRDMIEKRQLTHGAEQILAFVNSAQLEATRQNDFVTISWSPRTAENDWCFGATLGEAACDCAVKVPAESDFCAVYPIDEELHCDSTVTDPTDSEYCWPSVISNLNSGSRDLLKAIKGDGTYDPVRGIFENPGADLQLEISESYSLTLTMNRAGHASLCTDENQKVPGYEICQPENEEAES